MSYELINEYTNSRGVQLGVEEGVLRGVKILGPVSKNGRTYPKETMARALALYEGAKVNVNHPKGHELTPRSYESRLGRLENVRLGDGDSGMFADLRYNPKHALAEQLAWDAEHSPESVGFSHNVAAKTRRQGKTSVVEEITKVQSVDLVADPATTNGLYEAADQTSTSKESDDMADTLTLGQLKADYPQLIESIADAAVAAFKESTDQKARDAETKTLKEELDAYKVKEKLAADRQAVDKLIEAAKLPKLAVTDVFVESLMAADEATRTKLIEDRRTVTKPGTNGKPVSKEQGTTEGDDSSLEGLTTEQIGKRWSA